MTIDWSKAPEGATHYKEDWHCTSTGGVQYYKLDRAGWTYWGETVTKGWVECRQPVPGYSKIPTQHLPHPFWNGEGLPPVGTVCEWMHHQAPSVGDSEWHVGDIRYISDCTVIIGGEGCEHVHHPRNLSFRPIRTAEQIAAEDRETAIDRMIDDTNILTGIMSDRRTMARQLYDAGYRKQEQK